jgi:hypothetical protein
MVHRLQHLALFVAASALLSSSAAAADPQNVTMGEPYQAEINEIFDIGQTSIHVHVKGVPAGKQLVIRSVHGIAYGPLTENYKFIILSTLVGGTQQWHPIPTTGHRFNDPEAKATALIWSQDTYINAEREEDGDIFSFSLVRGNPGGFQHATFVRLNVSGYLIDAPATRLTTTTGDTGVVRAQ